MAYKFVCGFNFTASDGTASYAISLVVDPITVMIQVANKFVYYDNILHDGFWIFLGRNKAMVRRNDPEQLRGGSHESGRLEDFSHWSPLLLEVVWSETSKSNLQASRWNEVE